MIIITPIISIIHINRNTGALEVDHFEIREIEKETMKCHDRSLREQIEGFEFKGELPDLQGVRDLFGCVSNCQLIPHTLNVWLSNDSYKYNSTEVTEPFGESEEY